MATSWKRAKASPLSALSAQVDELGEIEARLAPHRADMARAEEIRRAIRRSYDDADAAATFEAQGAQYTALVGARGFQRAIDNAKLIKAVGQKAFAAIATVTLAAVDGLDLPGVAVACANRMQTGPRPLVIRRRAG